MWEKKNIFCWCLSKNKNSLFFSKFFAAAFFSWLRDINRHMSICTCETERADKHQYYWLEGCTNIFSPNVRFHIFFFSLFLLCLFFLFCPFALACSIQLQIYTDTCLNGNIFSPFSLLFSSSSLFRECLHELWWNEVGGGATEVHAEMREIQLRVVNI